MGDLEGKSSKNHSGKFAIVVLVIVLAMIIIMQLIPSSFPEDVANEINGVQTGFSKETFKILSSTENKDLEEIVKNHADLKGIKVSIDYAGTLEIMEKLNNKEEYDAVWISNSIWLYMLDSSVSVSNAKSTSINPVVFGITKNKAEELGLIDNEVYTKDILQLIKDKKLKFSMSNPTQTNAGATAYLGFLTTLAGNPEVLREEYLKKDELKSELKAFFSGVERSSGSDEFLEDMFINGSYEAVITYESSIIKINQRLKKAGKDPLYAIYTVDGVSISDSPFAYIDNGNSQKAEIFNELQSFILSDEGQNLLAKQGRRTWYGGVNENADKTIFNPEWGIDTTKYIVPVKYPSTSVIKTALNLYQSELRKPVHTVFCLDYSGSMNGSGYNELVSAMEYVLDEKKASENLLQFSENDKITVIPFSSKVLDVWNVDTESQKLLEKIKKQSPTGATNIYDTSIKALSILKDENIEKYNLSIILMTDGQSNVGEYSNLEKEYKNLKMDIPIYSITFGDANEEQLDKIAELTNAKVFDGKTDLLKAFKQVRGYN